jgi:hypothetical protein
MVVVKVFSKADDTMACRCTLHESMIEIMQIVGSGQKYRNQSFSRVFVKNFRSMTLMLYLDVVVNE